MKKIKIDFSMITRDPAEASKASKALEDLGCDGAYTFEGPHEPFLPLAAAALATKKLELLTSIAVAFSRSPMTLANIGYDLQLMSKGRFTLGIGSQIKPHIEKRYSMPWSSPAKRMKEMVDAIKAIWGCWHEGKDLDFKGEFYNHTLMTPIFNPGKNPFGLPKIYVAGVGPLMTQVAAESGDGFIVHPFHTSKFLENITLPSLKKGLDLTEKKDFDISIGIMIATGINDEEIAKSREACKAQIGFYGSTPAYKLVLEQHGWDSVQIQLNQLTKKGLWQDMASLVSDDMLEAIALTGTPSEVSKEIFNRYDKIASRIAPTIFSSDPATTSELIKCLKKQ
tara:strand:+ start:357 stop:1370 length:1014 start_codon:yes stop_codon:yes gene_type:complete